jgi:hypothetical protein
VVNSHRGDPAGIKGTARTELYSVSRLTPTCFASAIVPFPALSPVRRTEYATGETNQHDDIERMMTSPEVSNRVTCDLRH